MRYRDENGKGWADIIDFLTMTPKARRRIARLLGEIYATGGYSAESTFRMRFGATSRVSATCSRLAACSPSNVPPPGRPNT
jgi:hypothetical protein